MAQTPGQRVYLIRLARGDGVKNPETLRDFCKALEARGDTYDPSTISRTENGEREVTLADCVAFAALDPMGRGEEWVAFGRQLAHTREADEEADDSHTFVPNTHPRPPAPSGLTRRATPKEPK